MLAIGRLVRSGLGSPTDRIMYEELEDTDDLMELVEVRVVAACASRSVSA